MPDLPPELLRHILLYCDATTCRALRLVSRDMRECVAACAFPRKLTAYWAYQWLCDSTCQARVAATMLHPERDLYVYADIEYMVCYDDVDDVDDASYDVEYTLSAAAEITIIGTNLLCDHMPFVYIVGPVGHLVLHSVFFHARFRDPNNLCAAISLIEASSFPECPAQLREFVLSAWRIWTVDQLRDLAVDVEQEFRMTVHIANVCNNLTMRWSNFRRMLLEHAPIRLGSLMSARAVGNRIVFETTSNAVIDDPYPTNIRFQR